MSRGNRTKGPRVGRPRLAVKDRAKPVTMRLAPGTIRARNMLSSYWRCDRTRAVEEAVAYCVELILAGVLPPRKHRPALDGEDNT